MTTFAELVDATLLQFHGFTALQEQSTYLSASVSAGGTTLTVADGSKISMGMVEVDDELMWVDAVSGNTVTLAPYGRGYRGSTAATHAANARVAVAPMIPRFMVKRALNQAALAVYPQVRAVASTTFTYVAARATYALPQGAQNVISVSWQSVGPSLEWVPCRRYRVDSAAATATWATGVNLSIYDAIVPGRTVNVVYEKTPTVMSADSDVYTTVTGLPASTEDLITFGAAYRLIPFLDVPQLQGQFAESDVAAFQRSGNPASALGRYLLQMYQLRLQEESDRQTATYPTRSHYTR